MRYVILVVAETRQEIGHERIRGLILLAEHLEHLLLFDDTYGAGGQGDRRGHAKGIASQAKLTKKVICAQDGSDRKGMVFCASGEAHASFLNVKGGVGRGTLRVDVLFSFVYSDTGRPCLPGRSQKRNDRGEHLSGSWFS